MRLIINNLKVSNELAPAPMIAIFFSLLLAYVP